MAKTSNVTRLMPLLHHAAHAAHTAHVRHAAAAGTFLLRKFGNHGFGRDQQRSNRSRVLKCCTDNLDRVNNTHVDHVAVFTGLGVVAVGVGLLVEDLAHDDRSFVTCVRCNLAARCLQGAANDVDA